MMKGNNLMLRIIDGRDTGKTKKLLTHIAKTGGILLCRHPHNVRYKCEAYGLPCIRAYYYTDNITDMKGPIYIDELEAYVAAQMGQDFVGYTLSNED